MSAEDLAKRAIDWGTERWHSPAGLVAVLLGVVVVAVAFFAGVNVASLTRYEWSAIVLIVGAISGVWWWKHIPHVSSKCVGFGVAIVFEDDQAPQLRADFIATLRELLRGSHNLHQFQFVEFSQPVARRASIDDAYAVWLTRKANVHFLVYGRARLREGQHVLDLRWTVRHAPITKERSEQLAQDMSAVFPQRIRFTGNLLASEIAANALGAIGALRRFEYRHLS